MLARMLFQSWRFSIKRKPLAVITIFLAAGFSLCALGGIH